MSFRRHCKLGHAYTPDNTYVDHYGYRQCRTCRPHRVCSICPKPIRSDNSGGRCKACELAYRQTEEGREAVRKKCTSGNVSPRQFGMDSARFDPVQANRRFVAALWRCIHNMQAKEAA